MLSFLFLQHPFQEEIAMDEAIKKAGILFMIINLRISFYILIQFFSTVILESLLPSIEDRMFYKFATKIREMPSGKWFHGFDFRIGHPVLYKKRGRIIYSICT